MEVAATSLSIDGKTRRGAGTLRRGDATVLDDGHVRVDLRGWRRPRVRLVVKDIAVARELLASLGLDRRTGTSQFRIRRLRPYENLLLLLLLLSVPVVIALATLSGTLGPVGLLAAVLMPFVIRVLARVELTLGSDGLGLRTSLRRTFIPHSRIRNIARIWPEGHERGSRHEGEVVSWGFEIVLDDGTKHRIDTRPERFAAGVWKTDPVFASAFAAWSEAQASSATAAPHASALLARGGRSTREWIISLRELATDGAGGYRVPALDERARALRDLRGRRRAARASRRRRGRDPFVRSTLRGCASPPTTSPTRSCAAWPWRRRTAMPRARRSSRPSSTRSCARLPRAAQLRGGDASAVVYHRRVHLFGLTGGIASGKSVVAARLRARGVAVIDADQLARDAVAKGTPGLAEVVKAFGTGVLAADGALDRKKLATEVFTDDGKRKTLNGIVHPIVTMLTWKRAAELRDEGRVLACYEAALIVENNVADAFRPLIVVAAPEEAQIARAGARDGASAAEVRGRIRAQMPLDQKVRVADFVIENAGSLADLERRTDEVLTAVCERLDLDEDALSTCEAGD